MSQATSQITDPWFHSHTQLPAQQVLFPPSVVFRSSFLLCFLSFSSTHSPVFMGSLVQLQAFGAPLFLWVHWISFRPQLEVHQWQLRVFINFFFLFFFLLNNYDYGFFFLDYSLTGDSRLEGPKGTKIATKNESGRSKSNK